MANIEKRKSPILLRILAFVLDFFTVFLLFGYLIAKVTGNTTEGGFELNGTPALILFALMIAYFVVCYKFLGGTLWQRVFRIHR